MCGDSGGVVLLPPTLNSTRGILTVDDAMWGQRPELHQVLLFFSPPANIIIAVDRAVGRGPTCRAFFFTAYQLSTGPTCTYQTARSGHPLRARLPPGPSLSFSLAKALDLLNADNALHTDVDLISCLFCRLQKKKKKGRVVVADISAPTQSRTLTLHACMPPTWSHSPSAGDPRFHHAGHNPSRQMQHPAHPPRSTQIPVVTDMICATSAMILLTSS